MISNVKDLIRLHEDEKPYVYPDSLGYSTIGVGHLVDRRKGGGLSKEVIDLQFEIDYRDHTADLYKFQPWVESIDPVRRAVLEDMCFNMGIEPFNHNGFKDWPNFLRAVQTQQYDVAAQIMRNSLWAKQVKTRADRLANMMVSGNWPQE